MGVQYLDDISLKSECIFYGKNSGDFPGLTTIFKKCPLFINNKLNKLQIKLLWVFINYNKVLGSIKNKKFLNLFDPLSVKIPPSPFGNSTWPVQPGLVKNASSFPLSV